jgi:hypothetical protein
LGPKLPGRGLVVKISGQFGNTVGEYYLSDQMANFKFRCAVVHDAFWRWC